MSTINTTTGAGTSTDKTSATHKTTLDQTDFMTILLAQLKYQDPNNPMDDTQLATQTVQYSNLEALNNIKEGVQSLVKSLSSDSIASGVNYIGKSIKSSGYNLTVSDGTVSTLYYSLGEAVTNVTANVYDKDGDLIRSESLGSKSTGDYSYVWDGKDTNGNAVTDGTYGIIIKAENAEGKQVVVQSQISGMVTGVKNSNGTVYLQLADGRTVELANVTEVVNTATTGS
ncbi:MAG: flagellar hook assembly protein FlgD [Desulfovibrio sp.]|jgi:flagellar basal-body rod modification protein FlgD|nr:flagellar hook assembly protein FlgD [Desulfovibrio sp.]